MKGQQKSANKRITWHAWAWHTRPRPLRTQLSDFLAATVSTVRVIVAPLYRWLVMMNREEQTRFVQFMDVATQLEEYLVSGGGERSRVCWVGGWAGLTCDTTSD